jgi:probable phosphoglycerate mutase
MPALILVRHGETEWSASGRHTGRTDLALTERREKQAVAAGDVLRRMLNGVQPALIVSSPRQRAVRTAELAGFPPTVTTADAAEWDYGDYEGMTSAQIHERDPQWSVWTAPSPDGEDQAEVTVRVDRLLAAAAGAAADGPVLVFTHGHASRAIAARWLKLSVSAGAYFALGTGAVSALGHEHRVPVILRWNIDQELLTADDHDPTGGK